MLRTASLAALSLAAAPAWALTPDQLWARWQEQAASWGATLAAEASPGEGGALTLRGLTLAGPGEAPLGLPPESPVQELVLRPAPEGRVLIDLGLPGRIDVPSGDPAIGDMRVETQGLEVTASDSEGGRVLYAMALDSLRVVFIPSVDGPSMGLMGAEGGDVAMELSGLSASFPDGPDAARAVAVTLGLDGYAYVAGGDPNLGLGSQSGRGEGRSEATVAMTLPEGMGLDEIQDGSGFVRALEAGLALRVDLSSQPGEGASWFQGFPFAYSYSASTGASEGSLSIDATAVQLRGSFGGGSGTLSLPDQGLDALDLTYGAGEMEVAAPLSAEPGPFRYRVAMADVAVGDAAWDLLDPQGLIPREPFSVDVDVTGVAALDMAGLIRAKESGAVPPTPRIDSLEIPTFAVSAGGVAATAAGSFTFTTEKGMPVPAGTASARVEGLDRLLDALVELGWITTDDASEARIGLAFAFRAGDAPDVRVMDLETRADGSVIVNGVQVQ